jgi:pimeloyl-ACP methyl ester carboxylesterase
VATVRAVSMRSPVGKQPWTDVFFTAHDGLKLYARHYPAPGSRRRPLLCLAGLTRNSRDFHDLATALSQGAHARPVFALDYRGRGCSEHDPDWKNYAIPIEMLDVQDFITVFGLHRAAIVGTSRGGLIAMVLAAAQPTAIGAVVLNDIGPVIERAGLTRIAGYVGKTPPAATWQQATELVASMNRRAFPAVSDAQWEDVARQWFNEKDGRPAAGYDAKLGKSISVRDGPAPELWPQFMALSHAPLLVIRGGTSDLLSQATVRQMCARHPNSTALTVSGQGHAPLLKDEPTIAAIARFLVEVDAGRSVAGKDLSRAA